MEGLNGDVIKSMTFALNNQQRAHGNAWVTLTRAFNGENIRNHTDKVVDLSPMGCQTGFMFHLLIMTTMKMC